MSKILTHDNTVLTYRGSTHVAPGILLQLYEIVGCVERPTPEADAAWRRIHDAMQAFDRNDLELIKKFHGNPVLYHMTSLRHDVPEELGAAYLEEAKADAMRRTPVGTYDSSWLNNNGGDGGTGVSVRLVLK